MEVGKIEQLTERDKCEAENIVMKKILQGLSHSKDRAVKWYCRLYCKNEMSQEAFL
jgi:hypothetical protein